LPLPDTAPRSAPPPAPVFEPARALLFAIGVGVPTLVALALADGAAAMAAAIGAWNALMTDPRRGLVTRLFAIGFAVLAFSAAGTAGYELRDAPGWAMAIGAVLVVAAAHVPPNFVYLSIVMKLVPVIVVVIATTTIRGENLVAAFFAGSVFATLTALVEQVVRRQVAPASDPRKELAELFAGHRNDLAFVVAYTAAAALAMGCATLLGTGRPAWALLVSLFVMHPVRTQAVSNIFQRVGGTLVGVVVAWMIVTGVGNPWALAAIATLCATLAPAGMKAGQFTAGVVATVLVLILIDLAFLAQGGDLPLVKARLADTLVGAAAALVATVALDWWRRRAGG